MSRGSLTIGPQESLITSIIHDIAEGEWNLLGLEGEVSDLASALQRAKAKAQDQSDELDKLRQKLILEQNRYEQLLLWEVQEDYEEERVGKEGLATPDPGYSGGYGSGPVFSPVLAPARTPSAGAGAPSRLALPRIPSGGAGAPSKPALPHIPSGGGVFLRSGAAVVKRHILLSSEDKESIEDYRKKIFLKLTELKCDLTEVCDNYAKLAANSYFLLDLYGAIVKSKLREFYYLFKEAGYFFTEADRDKRDDLIFDSDKIARESQFRTLGLKRLMDSVKSPDSFQDRDGRIVPRKKVISSRLNRDDDINLREEAFREIISALELIELELSTPLDEVKFNAASRIIKDKIEVIAKKPEVVMTDTRRRGAPGPGHPDYDGPNSRMSAFSAGIPGGRGVGIG